MLLKFLRKRKNMKLIMWGIAILIIPAFVIWGSGSADRKKENGPDYAGKIFNKKVSFEEYADMWQVTRDYAIRTFGANIPPEFLDQLAWNRLILLEEAKRGKISVRDSEVVNMVMTFPAFQREGRFDKRLYQSMLRDSARGFEERLRDDILISRLREKILSGISVTDEEAREEYKKRFEKIRCSYVLMPFKGFEKDVTYQESDLLGFYNKNKALFGKPETINIRYIGILFASFDKEVFVEDDSIKKYFEEHIQDYKKPDSEETPELTDEIKKQVSEKISLDRKRSLAEELAYKVLDVSRDKKNLDEAARSFGLESNQTGFFSMQEEAPGIGWSYEFTKTGFELVVGEISNVLIKTDRGFYIIQLAEKKKSYIPVFTEAKDGVKDAYIKAESIRLAEKRAGEIYGQIRSGKDFNDISEELSLETRQTDLITRDSYVPGLGPAGDLATACASLKPGEISAPIKTQDSWAIARLDEYQDIEEKKFLEDKETFTEDLLTRKKQEAFDKWFEVLKKQAGFISYTTQ